MLLFEICIMKSSVELLNWKNIFAIQEDSRLNYAVVEPWCAWSYVYLSGFTVLSQQIFETPIRMHLKLQWTAKEKPIWNRFCFRTGFVPQGCRSFSHFSHAKSNSDPTLHLPMSFWLTARPTSVWNLSKWADYDLMECVFKMRGLFPGRG